MMDRENEAFDLRMETRSLVWSIEEQYACPFNFTGKIHRLLTDALGPHEHAVETN